MVYERRKKYCATWFGLGLGLGFGLGLGLGLGFEGVLRDQPGREGG